MLLIGLFYLVMAIIPAVISIFKDSVFIHIWHIISIWAALFFILLAACLYTGCYVKARSAFSSETRYSKLGSKMFAFIWTASFLLMFNAAWATAVAVLWEREKHRRYGHNDVYAAGAAYNSSSSDAHLDKSTYNSDQKPHRGTFFTRLRTKKKYTNTASTSEPEEVEYTTTDYVTQPAPAADRVTQAPAAV